MKIFYFFSDELIKIAFNNLSNYDNRYKKEYWLTYLNTSQYCGCIVYFRFFGTCKNTGNFKMTRYKRFLNEFLRKMCYEIFQKLQTNKFYVFK